MPRDPDPVKSTHLHWVHEKKFRMEIRNLGQSRLRVSLVGLGRIKFAMRLTATSDFRICQVQPDRWR